MNNITESMTGLQPHQIDSPASESFLSVTDHPQKTGGGFSVVGVGGCGVRDGAEAQPAPPAPGWLPASLSNTPPHVASSSSFDSIISTGGEDWLEWFSFVVFLDKTLPIQKTFQEAKEFAQFRRKPTLVSLPDSEGGVMQILVDRMGRSIGGTNGIHFEFCLTWQGLQIHLGNRNGIGEKHPNLHCTATGSDCLIRPAIEIYRRVQWFMKQLGGESNGEGDILSRVDACLDLPGVDIGEFVRPFKRKRFVTTAKKWNSFDGESGCTGFSVGKSPCRLIVYDKLEQAMSDGDRLYLLALQKYRWGGVLPEFASRVEFQLSREILPYHGVSSPNDWFAKRASILSHLTSDHFRLIKSDSNRLRRCSTSNLWEKVQSGFRSWCGSAHGDLSPLPRAEVDTEMYARQASGCVATALIQRGVSITSKAEFIELAKFLLEEYISEEKLLADFQRKQISFGC